MSDKSLEETSHYQVLARKYRPATFSDLIGQDVMVKILENSFQLRKIAHAFMLTGVRGVGKTTTARIIAKGLNCIGLDGTGPPTVSPCGKCDNCLSIATGNHVDVMEFDAASRTGVSDIREIIDSVHYRAATARFKIYVIDEVHMLSTSAFNALLKTLEEPPKHVKFLFATTEVNKIPSTVLSRCQRFDLRRIGPKTMVKHLKSVSTKEGFSIPDDCLGQIARVSEGSVRDALSLLEQIFVDTDGNATLERVRSILGLADRGRLLDLFEFLMSGDIEAVLTLYNALYEDGADPINVLKELCEITHWITLYKVSPSLEKDITISPEERSRGKIFSDQLSIRELARTWQLLLKVLDESSSAFNTKISVEMGLIRISYSSSGPTPDELIKKLIKNKGPDNLEKEDQQAAQSGQESDTSEFQKKRNSLVSTSTSGRISVLQNTEEDEVKYEKQGIGPLSEFKNVIELIKVNRDLELLIEIENNLRLVHYQNGRIEYQPTADASKHLASRLSTFLKEQTGERWIVSVVSSGGGKTIREINIEENLVSEKEAMGNPIVSTIFTLFPKSKFHRLEKIGREENGYHRSRERLRTEVESFVWDPVEKE